MTITVVRILLILMTLAGAIWIATLIMQSAVAKIFLIFSAGLSLGLLLTIGSALTLGIMCAAIISVVLYAIYDSLPDDEDDDDEWAEIL